MIFKAPFQPNPIYDSLIINWKSVNYKMLINTYSSRNTLLASITGSSNLIHTRVLALPWAHAPSAPTLTHGIIFLRKDGLPHFSSLSHGCFGLSSPMCDPAAPHSLDGDTVPMTPSNLGLGAGLAHMLPELPVRNDIHSEVAHQGSAATPGFLSIYCCLSFIFISFHLKIPSNALQLSLWWHWPQIITNMNVCSNRPKSFLYHAPDISFQHRYKTDFASLITKSINYWCSSGCSGKEFPFCISKQFSITLSRICPWCLAIIAPNSSCKGHRLKHLRFLICWWQVVHFFNNLEKLRQILNNPLGCNS